MKNRYIIGVVALVLFFSTNVMGQSLPNIHVSDFGFASSVKSVEQMYYSVEDDEVDSVEKVIYNFDNRGNILQIERQSFVEPFWEKSVSKIRKNKIRKITWTSNQSFLRRTQKFSYNHQGKIVRQKIKHHEKPTDILQYDYDNGKLTKIKATLDGAVSETNFYYTIKGNLYKSTYRQKNDAATHTFYLQNKSIFAYDEPQNNIYADFYLRNLAQAKIKIVENNTALDKAVKGIQRFDKEAPNDNLPFDLSQYSAQNFQFFDKNRQSVNLFSLLFFAQDQHKNIIAEAEVNPKTNKIAIVGFFKITFVDGTTVGTTDFDKDKMSYFYELLSEFNLQKRINR